MLRLPEKDYRIIDAYRAEMLPTYLTVPAEDLLADQWSAKKEYLYNLLGNNFDISKEITYEKPEEELKKEMYNLLEASPFASNFRKWIRNHISETAYLFQTADYVAPGISVGICDSNEELYQISRLLDVDNLINNNITFQSQKTVVVHKPDGHDYKFDSHSRPLRVLKCLSEAFQIEGYEDFRLAHSRILNQKTVKGDLHLSIHPLDFYTMSVNANDWTSCMRWDPSEPGEYCMGTVEMCNSPYVLVAYLSSSKTLDIADGEYTWNSKKWRELFLVDCVDQKFIASIKGYPIWDHNLERIVLEWLAELARPEKEYTISAYDFSAGRKENNPFHFSTNFMYNDFCYPQHLILTWDDLYGSNEVRAINYSGEAQCMVCGCSDVSYADSLCCNNCEDITVCAGCGSRLYDWEEEEEYVVEGETVCKSCWENSTQCDDCGEIFWNDHTLPVSIGDFDFYFCEDCFNTFFTKDTPLNNLTDYYEPTYKNLTIKGEQAYGNLFE